MANLFNSLFNTFFGWTDTNPNNNGYATYAYNNGYFGTRFLSAETPAIKYRTGTADFSLDVLYKAPAYVTTPYDLWIVYRFQDNNNFRYVKIVHEFSTAVVYQYTCISGVHADTGLVLPAYEYNSTADHIFQSAFRIRLGVKGQKQTYLRIDDLATGRAVVDSGELQLGTALQTQTGLGFFIAQPATFSQNSPTYFDFITIHTYSADDKQKYIHGSEIGGTGVMLGGSPVVMQPVLSTATLRIGGSPIRNNGYSYQITGNLELGASSYDPNKQGALIITGTAAVNHGSYHSGAIIIGGLAITNDSVALLKIGGTADIVFNYVDVSTGNLILTGNKYANGFSYRRQITIPANTFVEPCDYYLGLRLLGIEEILQVTDTVPNIVRHEVRSYCVGGFTHLFFSAFIDDPSIDNVWFIYYEEEEVI